MPAPRILECTACRDLFATADRDSGFARWGQGESVRLINNPAVWGADRPRFSLLGFSKGDTQNKAMAQVKAGQLPLEAVPFKGMRKRLGWLLDALGIRAASASVDNLFTSQETTIRSASLIRCSISAKSTSGDYSYKLADILAADSPSGGKVREILKRCIRRHAVPDAEGQTFVMLGLDPALITLTRDAFSSEPPPRPPSRRSGDPRAAPLRLRCRSLRRRSIRRCMTLAATASTADGRLHASCGCFAVAAERT